MNPIATNPKEISVSREKRQVHIWWQDGHESVYSFDWLRKECPCALCNDQRNKQSMSGGLSLTVLSGPVLKAGEIQAVPLLEQYMKQIQIVIQAVDRLEK